MNVLEQALEALEAMIDYIPDNTVQGDWDAGLAFNAIAALKEAIAKQGEPVAWVSESTIEKQLLNGKPRRVWYENNTGVGLAIYTSAPTKEQP